MRAYVKEVPGKVHNKTEDSHYEEVRRLSDGVEAGIFLVADGLSGYGGINASHITIRSLRDDLGKRLLSPSVRNIPRDDRISMLRDSVITANEELVSIGGLYTTLDALAVVGNEAYIAHLGDSRIYAVSAADVRVITPDESSEGVPANYLGCYKINGVSIEERIRLSDISLGDSVSLGKDGSSLFFLLATDGLHSRLSEFEIADVLLTLHERYINPKNVLDELARRVYYPECKLRELVGRDDDLVAKLRAVLPAKEMVSPEEIVTETFRLYEERNNDVVGVVDTAIRFDDTTLILVDLSDSVESQMRKLCSLDKDVVPSLKQHLGEAEQAVQQKEKEIQRLQGDYDTLDQSYRKICDDLTSSRDERERLQRDFFAQRRDLQDEIRVLQEQRDTLSTQLAEKSGFLGAIGNGFRNLFRSLSQKDHDSSGKRKGTDEGGTP